MRHEFLLAMTNWDIALSFIVGVIASICAAFFFPAIQELVTDSLVRALAWLPAKLSWLPVRRKYDMSGAWRSEWTVESKRYSPSNVDESAQVRQFGKRFFARVKVGSPQKEKEFECFAKGTVDGSIITGTWYDAIAGGYHGTFQFVIDPATHEFNGKWIGYSASGTVKGGDWIWSCHRPIGKSNPPSA